MKRMVEHKAPKGLGLECGYKDCAGKFIVNEKKIKTKRATNPSRIWHTCVCPYCFRTQLLPWAKDDRA